MRDGGTALRAGLALTGSAACWGFATVATKGLLAELPPITLLVTQLLASVAFLWVAALVTRSRLPGLGVAGLAAVSGLFEPGLAYLAEIIGLGLTTASTASLIAASETPMIILVAWVVLGERMGARALLLAGVAGAGVVLLLVPDLQGIGGGSLAGDGLCLAAHFLAAIYVTASRRLVGAAAPLPLAAVQQTAGLLLGVAVLGVGRLAGWSATGAADFTWGTLLLAAVSGIVQYAVAFWLYLTGLRHYPASRSGVFLSLVPVFGVGGAAVALGEELALVQWVGAVVVVGAVQAMMRAGAGGAEPVTLPAAPPPA